MIDVVNLVTLLTFLILAPIVLVTCVFALELLAGLAPLQGVVGNAPARTVIVIPAHDEEAVICGTVAELKSETGGDFAVLVVADNCVDGTAAAARCAGAEVVIRTDPKRRGKGFALAAARDHLRADPPEVVIVVDADCRIDADSMRALAGAANATAHACQAINLLSPDLAAPPMVQISTFAFVIKNLIRQRGLQRLAGQAHLTGTGMALPWAIFAEADLGGANIVEDLALGLHLAERRLPPRLIEQAKVWSPSASAAGTLVQRRRWEGGYIATALRTAPKALARSLGRADLRGMFAALDLCIPPLALLVVLNGIAFLFASAVYAVGAGPWPLIVQVSAGIVAFGLLVLAWAREGRRFASGSTLLRLPIYVFWKIPMYIGLLRRGAPKEWLRTGR
jgi:cellulose synthase/poly-beta-1,6-N-acetylglucosamine synthase-like glycosyltransferase